jgi:DUF4097 and DUF4098 domain-containing protein YvlB
MSKIHYFTTLKIHCRSQKSTDVLFTIKVYQIDIASEEKGKGKTKRVSESEFMIKASWDKSEKGHDKFLLRSRYWLHNSIKKGESVDPGHDLHQYFRGVKLSTRKALFDISEYTNHTHAFFT